MSTELATPASAGVSEAAPASSASTASSASSSSASSQSAVSSQPSAHTAESVVEAQPEGTQSAAPAPEAQAAPEAPAPPPTLEELLERVTGYEGQLESLKPYEAINENYGGFEAIQPVLEFNDICSGVKQFNTVEEMHEAKLQQLSQIDPDFKSTLWHAIDKDLEAIAADENVRQAVLASDPDFQAYKQWQETGQLPVQQELDPNDPIQAELIQARKERAEAEAFRKQQLQEKAIAAEQQRIENIKSYDTTQIDWLKQQASALKWGEEFQPIADMAVKSARNDFFSDPKAQAALKRARDHHLAGPSNKAQLEIATKAVQNILGKYLKQYTEPLNRVIQAAHQGMVATRKEQEGRPVIPGSAAAASAGAGAEQPDFSKMTADERVTWRYKNARETGRIRE